MKNTAAHFSERIAKTGPAKTGMEPFFGFWEKLCYAIDQIFIEFKKWKEYYR